MLKRLDQPNPAETAILAASSVLPQSALRAKAADLLRERGLPTRKIEAWHYTDLRARLKAFDGIAKSPSLGEAKAWLAANPAFVPAFRVPFLNGALQPTALKAPPAGLSIAPATAQQAITESDNAVGLLNAALLNGGVAIEVSAGAALDTAIEIVCGSTVAGAWALRNKVAIGPGARAGFVERHAGKNDLNIHANVVTDLAVGDGGNVTWAIIGEEGDKSTQLTQLNVALGANANLAILVLNRGGALVRREIHVAARGANSGFRLRGVNLIGAGSHVDVMATLVHQAPHVTATEIFRNVVSGDGSGAFQGRIKVESAAQKTDARMACNTLLLSDEAEFAAKPELEIFADDVQCAHGATVADVLDDHLFYLRSRGIPLRDARAMLIKAFVEDVFDAVESEVLRDKLNERIEDWLENNG